MVAVEGEQPRHEGPEKKFESLSPGLDTFSRLLEENCHGLDADSVFLLTQRVRAELAVIQHEVEESRVKLRKALLRERIHRRQQLLVDPKQPTLSNSAASTAEETQPSQGEPDQRSILENIEKTINVAEDKVRLYLQKIRQIEARHDIVVVPRESFIRMFLRAHAPLDDSLFGEYGGLLASTRASDVSEEGEGGGKFAAAKEGAWGELRRILQINELPRRRNP